MKNRKIICCLIVAMIVIFFNSNLVLSADTITEQGKDWLNTGEKNQPEHTIQEGTLSTAINRALGLNSKEGFEELAGILTGLGIFVIAIVGVVLGIRLMFTNSNDKAKAKEALIIYLVGAVIILGAVGIWKLLITILDASYLY